MPRLFRQSPLNAIWEGSGNVIALDALRALTREPQAWEALRAELGRAQGAHPLLDAAIDRLDGIRVNGVPAESEARAFVETVALSLEAVCLRDAPSAVLAGFCVTRLDPDNRAFLYGGANASLDTDRLLARALPSE
ncbi:putative acyl-CoA dehydrogenase [Altererythrobacter atlanticus]|nr:Putative acyl-CoA dehydrogenase AidB [Croceibacterium atlanticum]MBB5731736.1 putative acyl-CoA dehydrogenase [Croceibacterium atlanticum]